MDIPGKEKPRVDHTNVIIPHQSCVDDYHIITKDLETELDTSKMDKDFIQYQEKRITHWDTVARKVNLKGAWGKYYHRRLAKIYQFLVPPGQHVLELGCSQGDLLAAFIHRWDLE